MGHKIQLKHLSQRSLQRHGSFLPTRTLTPVASQSSGISSDIRCCLSFPSKKSATKDFTLAVARESSSGLNLAMSSPSLIALNVGSSLSVIPKNSRILL